MTKSKKHGAARRNKFAALASDEETPTPSPAAPEQASQEAVAGSQAPPSMHEEDDAEVAAAAPPAAAPTVTNAPKVQTNLSGFVKPRPRKVQPLRAPRTPADLAKAAASPAPPAQPNLRLQFIENALKANQADDGADDGFEEVKAKGKRRRNDDDDEEEGRARPAPPASSQDQEWDIQDPEDLEEEEDYDDMYTDESGDDCPPQVKRRAPTPADWTLDDSIDAPAHGSPSIKRGLYPGAIKQPKGRVNPFARLQPSQTPAPRNDAGSRIQWAAAPPGGFVLPNIGIVELFKRTTQASKARLDKIKGDKVYILILGDGRIVTAKDFARRIAFLAMAVKSIINDPHADPTITITEVDINLPNGGGTVQHKPPQMYAASNIALPGLKKLSDGVHWSSKEISICVFPQDIPIPTYCLTLTETTFLKADKAAEDKMTEQVRAVLTDSKDFAAFVRAFDDRRPSYMGHKGFLQYTIDSAKALPLMIEQNGSPLVIFRVHITSPTNDAEEWEKVCQGLRTIDWTGHHCAMVVARTHDYHCGFCKALDHPTPQCPLPGLGIHPNTLDDPVDAAQPSRGDDERVNPFDGQAPMPSTRGGNQSKRAGSRQPDNARPPNSRGNGHHGTPRPPPHVYGPAYQYPQYQPAPRFGDASEGAGPSHRAPPNPGRGRGGRRGGHAAGHMPEWQMAQQWNNYPAYHSQGAFHAYGAPPAEHGPY
ncbi:hypothetical protein DFP72DRAFT_303654 [Ephemerocybe angulata]|uniref:Uncharacterized protein n=1 Tax=Ephemerocybe angulata TaxID=980116 RepID=A0A8H6M8C9_9AGAR|nr:hypothetical protein DFP72DRAFT_303654 [Tulosesus angulatus]